MYDGKDYSVLVQRSYRQRGRVAAPGPIRVDSFESIGRRLSRVAGLVARFQIGGSRMRRVRLALAQINTTVGDLDGNVGRVIESMQRAREAGADIVAFPELTLPGYGADDLLLRPDFIEANLQALYAVASEAREISAVIGFVDRVTDLYNAAAIVHDGDIVGVHHKRCLSNHGVFDESRYFGVGRSAELYRVGESWIGLAIGEDTRPAGDPLAYSAMTGADILIHLSASPFSRGTWRRRQAALSTRATDYNAVIASVNLVGGQDELVYDGKSLVVDVSGDVLAEAPSFEEDLLLCDVDLDRVARARLGAPRHRREVRDLPDVARRTVSGGSTLSRPPLPAPSAVEHDDLGEVYAALVLATRDYVRKNGFHHVALGVSGGIDSALVTAIAVDAVGADRVTGVTMPSRYTSEATRGDADRLAEALGIELQTLSIEPTFKALLETLEPAFQDRESDLTEENIQARIRGILLMALSNKFGWLVLTSGNKSEFAIGYSTLYGDSAGGFSVIKDVTKTLVYALARWRNAQGPEPVIPESIIERPPSAELRPGQLDEDSLPSYDLLDPVLELYVEEDWSEEEIVAEGYEADLVRRVIGLVDRSEFKRRQTPPGARISARGFGRDRRYPITARHDWKRDDPDRTA